MSIQKHLSNAKHSSDPSNVSTMSRYYPTQNPFTHVGVSPSHGGLLPHLHIPHAQLSLATAGIHDSGLHGTSEQTPLTQHKDAAQDIPLRAPQLHVPLKQVSLFPVQCEASPHLQLPLMHWLLVEGLQVCDDTPQKH